MRNGRRNERAEHFHESPAGHGGVHRLAWLLDRSIPLPGGFRIGLDGLLGLIPGMGDLLGGGLSTWIFYQAWREGVSYAVLARMLINILVDTLVGAIPLLGDLFDFVWKANSRNLALLDDYRRAPARTRRRSLLSTLLILAGLVAVLLLLLFALTAIVAWAWRLVSPETA